MKKILAIALLSAGISIVITNSPAHAGVRVEENDTDRLHRIETQVVPQNTPYTPSSTPSYVPKSAYGTEFQVGVNFFGGAFD